MPSTILAMNYAKSQRMLYNNPKYLCTVVNRRHKTRRRTRLFGRRIELREHGKHLHFRWHCDALCAMCDTAVMCSFYYGFGVLTPTDDDIQLFYRTKYACDCRATDDWCLAEQKVGARFDCRHDVWCDVCV